MTKKQLNVLVVDDEPAIREMVRAVLNRSGMAVTSAASGHEALQVIGEQKPDILLLDWMMPGISGLEVTRRLRKDPLLAGIPIIMLTARVTEDDKVAGLNAGTDDYIVKPFSPRELVARIHAVVRRTSPADDAGIISVGKIALDPVSRQVFLNSKPSHLRPTEYRLLEFFITHPGRALSRSQLLDHVWGTHAYLEERTVDVHIRRLRKILSAENLDHYIQTVRSHGYRLVAGDD